MSVRASSWAWESSRSTGSAFLVLLALADHAGQDGGDCWPSVARLARRCRVDERTVQRALDKLQELGELVVEHNAGPRGTNRYRLTMATAPPLDLDGPQPGDNPGEEAPGLVEPRQDATPGKLPPPASTTETPGTTPPEPSTNQQTTTPLPPASGGPESASAHWGQHRSCRACGTNRRGASKPAPVVDEAAEAERRRQAADEALARTRADAARRAAEAEQAVPPPPGLRDLLHPPISQPEREMADT